MRILPLSLLLSFVPFSYSIWANKKVKHITLSLSQISSKLLLNFSIDLNSSYSTNISPHSSFLVTLPSTSKGSLLTYRYLQSQERVIELEIISLDNPEKRFEGLTSYLLEQQVSAYYPSFEELNQFLKLLASIDLNTYVQRHTDLQGRSGSTQKVLYRLFHVPSHKNQHPQFIELVRNAIVKTFILSLSESEIPMSFFQVIASVCDKYSDEEYCAKRSEYIQSLTAGEMTYEDLITMAYHIITTEFVLTKDIVVALLKFPMLYGMYLGEKSLLQIMLENHPKALELLKISPLPYFSLHRVDNLIFCENGLSQFLDENSVFYLELQQQWVALLQSCFQSTNHQLGVEAYELYSHYEYNQLAVHHARKVNIFGTFTKANINTFKQFLGQYLPTLLTIATTIGNYQIAITCTALLNKSTLLAQYWNPRTNTVSRLMDLWGTAATRHCPVEEMKESFRYYHRSMPMRDLPFPREAMNGCFTPKDNNTQLPILESLDASSTNLSIIAQRHKIIQAIQKENEMTFSRFGGDFCEVLNEVNIKHFFNDQNISEKAFSNLVLFFDGFPLSKIDKVIKKIHRTKYFNQYLKLATPQVIKKIIQTTGLVALSMEDPLPHSGLYSLFDLLYKLDARRTTINNDIKAAQRESYNSLSLAQKLLKRPLEPKPFASIDTSHIAPYHIILMKKIMSLARSTSSVKYGFYQKNMRSAGERFLNCLKSLTRYVEVNDSEALEQQHQYLAQRFQPDDYFMSQLIDAKICVEDSGNLEGYFTNFM